ncbi:hypothetical protein [Mycobacterium sp. ITM-2016-00318]|uniref:hypothetical protein n=1 Tax=Mycobacterium sp. ITM-2016-00318 TaxID=2099693 RepID=UPI001304A303|nr:hypothetical protein [Mycobacterium sp. ITM-2016-00318]WNG93885.1 hypothetical protein C6A82_005355 [Mycobacterium sp. ITM-2016-00318]
MSNGGKVALAVGAGYMLGRTKKMRLALMLAAAGITGKFPTSPTALVGQGLKSLGANADVTQLTEQLRGELLNAGRAAALSAATSQIESLNDRLQGVTSAVDVDDTLDDVGGLLGGKRRRKRSADDYDEDDAYDEADEADEDEEPLDVEEVDEDFEDEADEADDEDVDEADEADIDDEDVDEAQDLDEDEDLDDEPEEEPEPPVTRRRAARRVSAPRKSSTPRKSTRATKRTAARSTTRRGR